MYSPRFSGASHTMINNKKNNKASASSQKSKVPMTKSIVTQKVVPAIIQNQMIMGGGSPNFSTPSIKDPNIRISHSEYLFDINMYSGSFNSGSVVPVSINPGLAFAFPWLSQIAVQFERYEFHDLTFHYRTQVGTSVSGKILMTYDADAADAIPSTKTLFLESQVKVDGPVYANVDMKIPKQLLKDAAERFVRAAPVVGTDIKTYDTGLVFINCAGPAALNPTGEIWVSYDITLKTPQFQTLLTQDYGSNAPSASAPWGTLTSLINLGAQVFSPILPTNTLLANVAGTFLFEAQLTGTSIPNGTFPAITQAASSLSQNVTFVTVASVSSGVNAVLSWIIVQEATTQLSIAFSAWLGAGTLTGVRFRVTPYSSPTI